MVGSTSIDIMCFVYYSRSRADWHGDRIVCSGILRIFQNTVVQCLIFFFNLHTRIKSDIKLQINVQVKRKFHITDQARGNK